ncbi:MAG: hypothetical protein HY516_02875 [Candidatus Aenigmarchaeota archaeon]|nr:hypothetical protein [Candidatus Aenigmarchaeota archaeon]
MRNVFSCIHRDRWLLLGLATAFLLYLIPFTKLAGSLIILLLVPGISIFSRFSGGKYNLAEYLVISSIMGLAYQIIAGYYLSFIGVKFMWTPALILVSLVPVVFYRQDRFLKIDREERMLFAGLALIVVSTFLVQIPRSDVASIAFENIGPFPVGDDSKLHALLVKEILGAGKIPGSITLYPEVSPVRYPMGYHAIISELYVLSGSDYFALMFFAGHAMFSLLVLAVYVAGKSLLSKNVGFYSALLIPGAVSPFKLLTLGIYPNLMANLIQVIAVVFLIRTVRKNGSVLVLGFLTASTLLVNPYPFVFLFLLSLVALKISKSSVFKYLFLFALLAAPYIPNVLSLSSSVEHKIQVEKFYPSLDVISGAAWAPNVDGIMNYVNVSLLTLGLAGVLFFDDKRLKIIWYFWFISLLILSFKLLLPVASAMTKFIPGLNTPFLYYLLPERVLYQMFIPAVLSAAYLIDKILGNRRVEPVIFIAFISALPVLLMYVQADKHDYKYITEGDIEFLNFTKNTVAPGETIFNDFPFGTPTTWIPVLSERRVTFPFIIFDPTLARDSLKADNLYKIKIVSTAPDSREAFDILRGFNASYVAFSTFFNILNTDWDENKFFRSKCYEKLYGKNELWLFKFDPNCPYDNWITLNKTSNIETRSGGGNVITMDYSNLKIGPPVTDIFGPYLYLYFNDTKPEKTPYRESIRLSYVVDNRSVPAEIEIAHTKNRQLYIIPLKQEVLKYKSLEISSDEGLELYSAELKLNAPNAYYADGAHFVGNWEQSRGHLASPAYSLQSFIILFNVPKGKIKLTYLDESDSNVDINAFDGVKWDALEVIYRKNTSSLVTIEKDVPMPVKFLYAGVYPYAVPFYLKSLEIISTEGRNK